MFVIERALDAERYYVRIEWQGEATLSETGPHVFTAFTDQR